MDVRFGEPSAAFRPLPVAAEPNPDYRPDVLAAVGQVADVRDLSAYLYQLAKPDLAAEARRAAWIGLVLTGVALALPEVGAAVAGVGRLALRGGPEAERLAPPLVRRVGRGNALKLLEQELAAARIEAHAEAALARVSGYLRDCFAAVERTWLPVGEAVRAAAREALAGLGRVAAEGRAVVRQVAAESAAKVEPLLAKIEREGERAAGTTNARVEQQAGAEAAGRPPEPEGPGTSPQACRAAQQRAV